MPLSAELAAQMPPEVNSAAEANNLAESIADRHGSVISADQTCLFYRYWPAEKNGNGHVVIVLHGIGYQSGPYQVIADGLNPSGIDVYGLDARGHGLSGGQRGYLGTPALVVEDVAAMVQFVKRQRPAAKVFLMGDSMGSNYALAYAREHSGELAGLVLLAPAFYVDPSQFFHWESLRLMPYFFLAHRRPVIDLLGKRLEESTRDPNFVAARRRDPLAYKKVSFGYVLDIQRLIWNWRRQIAPRVRIPILMIKGERDRVVSQSDCLTFARISASPDKQLKMYPGVYHTTLWDPQTPEILHLAAEWIGQR
jgi:acylglycerol lipase